MEERENEAFVCMMVHCDAFRRAQRKETPNTCTCICGPSARTDEGIKIAQEKEVKEGWRGMKVHFLIKYSGFPPELHRICLPRPGHHRRGQLCLNVSQVFSLKPSDLHPLTKVWSFQLSTHGVAMWTSVHVRSSRPLPVPLRCSGICSLCFDFLLSTRSSTSGVIRHTHSGISESRGQM